MCKLKCTEYGGYKCSIVNEVICCIDCDKIERCKLMGSICPSVKFYKDKEDLKNNCIFSSENKDGAK